MLTVTCPSLLYLASVLYFLQLGQIQHTCAFEVYNMEIKVHFPLILPTQSTINVQYAKYRYICT